MGIGVPLYLLLVQTSPIGPILLAVVATSTLVTKTPNTGEALSATGKCYDY